MSSMGTTESGAFSARLVASNSIAYRLFPCLPRCAANLFRTTGAIEYSAYFLDNYWNVGKPQFQGNSGAGASWCGQAQYAYAHAAGVDEAIRGEVGAVFLSSCGLRSG
jgi:hypothetical protein